MMNKDRSANMMPTQDPFMRYVSSAPIRRNYQPPVNAEPLLRTNEKLKPIPEGNKGKGLRTMAASGPAGKEKVEEFGYSPALRKNKFCGGMSKPYSRKK